MSWVPIAREGSTVNSEAVARRARYKWRAARKTSPRPAAPPRLINLPRSRWVSRLQPIRSGVRRPGAVSQEPRLAVRGPCRRKGCPPSSTARRVALLRGTVFTDGGLVFRWWAVLLLNDRRQAAPW